MTKWNNWRENLLHCNEYNTSSSSNYCPWRIDYYDHTGYMDRIWLCCGLVSTVWVLIWWRKLCFGCCSPDAKLLNQLIDSWTVIETNVCDHVSLKNQPICMVFIIIYIIEFCIFWAYIALHTVWIIRLLSFQGVSMTFWNVIETFTPFCDHKLSLIKLRSMIKTYSKIKIYSCDMYTNWEYSR